MQISKQSTQNRCPKKYIETGTFQRPIFQWCADQKTQNRTLYSVRDFAFFGPHFKRAPLKNWPQSEIVRKRLRETPFAGEGKLRRVIRILFCTAQYMGLRACLVDIGLGWMRRLLYAIRYAAGWGGSGEEGSCSRVNVRRRQIIYSTNRVTLFCVWLWRKKTSRTVTAEEGDYLE